MLAAEPCLLSSTHTEMLLRCVLQCDCCRRSVAWVKLNDCLGEIVEWQRVLFPIVTGYCRAQILSLARYLLADVISVLNSRVMCWQCLTREEGSVSRFFNNSLRGI